MDLEKRVAVIEQKLGISMDSASTNISPTIIPSTDTTSTNVSPTIIPSTDTTSTNISPAIPPSTNVTSTVVPSIVPSTNTSTVPDSTTISINGYNGTVKDLFSKIRSKISDLDRAANKGRYSSRVTELKTLLGNLTKATTVQDIQSAIGTKLKFKNDNSLMGGKSKRRGRKTKKSNKSNKSKRR